LGTKYFRVVAGNVGIYEAVDKDCPRDDSRRENKPDGSWLPKVGMNYPNAVSLWTEFGMKKYIKSGLLKWHASVVNSDVFVLECLRPKEKLYEDEYQVICDKEFIQVVKKIKLADFSL